MSIYVDRSWFESRIAARGLSMSEVARRMHLDKSALSRVLSGKRNLRAAEVVEIATIIGASEADVWARLKPRTGGEEIAKPEERGGQRKLKAGRAASEEFVAPRHPAFGFMRGLLTPVDGCSPTEPVFPDWEEYVEKKYGAGSEPSDE